MISTVTFQRRIFLLLLSSFLFSACQKSNPSAPTVTTTPPTCAMTVNGTTITLGASATYTAPAGQISFSANGGGYVIQFFDKSPTLGSITLADPNTTSYATVVQPLNNITWLTDTIYTGTLTLTTYNTSSKTISGKISFIANEKNPTTGGSTISITNGTFANVPY